MKHSPNYTKAVVIVHGKTELIFVNHIKANLHLPIKIKSENNGKNSIQINGLMKNILNKRPFNDLKTFSDEYGIEYDKKTKKLKNFKLFIIMDIDDCSREVKEKYKFGELFEGHILKDYIVPIYNDPDIDAVFINADIISKKVFEAHKHKKGSYYKKIFSNYNKSSNYDASKEIKSYKQKISGVRGTNMIEFIDYCLKNVQKLSKTHS